MSMYGELYVGLLFTLREMGGISGIRIPAACTVMFDSLWESEDG
jgi:hypothetical protein